MKKSLFLFAAALLFVLPPSMAFSQADSADDDFAGGEEKVFPFALNLGWDIGIGGAALAAYGTGFILKHTLTFPSWTDFSYDRNNIPVVDEAVVRQYSRALDVTGTVTCAADVTAPLLLFGGFALAKKLEWSDALTVGVMYMEAFVLTEGIKDLLKISVRRLRPYTYYDVSTWDVDPDKDNDFMFSFPSGHTSRAFMSAGFITSVFFAAYPEVQWKWAVAAGSYAVALTTGVLRMMSGNHFFTDVLTGAAIGTVIGWGVPMVHHVFAKKSGEVSAVQVSPLPLGICVRINFGTEG